MAALYALVALVVTLVVVVSFGRATNRRRDYRRALSALSDLRNRTSQGGREESSREQEEAPTQRSDLPGYLPLPPPEATRPLPERAHLVFDDLAPDVPAAPAARPPKRPVEGNTKPRAVHLDRRLVGVFTAIVALAGIAIGLELTARSSPPPRAATSTTRPVGKPTTPSSSPTSTTTTLGPSGGKPTIDSVQPSSVTAGSIVTLVGTGFASPNGQIVALVSSKPAPTDCTTEERCTVTILGSSTSGAITIQLHTESGLSNIVSVHYR